MPLGRCGRCAVGSNRAGGHRAPQGASPSSVGPSIREVVSILCDVLVQVLHPRLGSFDVNGSPKMTYRDGLAVMDCKEKQ